MTVYFIGAGPGAADLITVRGARTLAACRVCLYAGSLVPRELLAECPPDARLVDTAQLDLDQITAELVRAHEEGHDVARLHSGDPSVFSAVAEQMRRLDAAGVPYEVVPGVPAFAAAAAALKRELTVPTVGQTVILTRIAQRATAMPEGEDLATLGRSGALLVLHLAARYVDRVVEELLPHYGADCPAAVVGDGQPPRRAGPARHAGRTSRAGEGRRGGAHGGDHGGPHAGRASSSATATCTRRSGTGTAAERAGWVRCRVRVRWGLLAQFPRALRDSGPCGPERPRPGGPEGDGPMGLKSTGRSPGFSGARGTAREAPTGPAVANEPEVFLYDSGQDQPFTSGRYAAPEQIITESAGSTSCTTSRTPGPPSAGRASSSGTRPHRHLRLRGCQRRAEEEVPALLRPAARRLRDQAQADLRPRPRRPGGEPPQPVGRRPPRRLPAHGGRTGVTAGANRPCCGPRPCPRGRCR